MGARPEVDLTLTSSGTLADGTAGGTSATPILATPLWTEDASTLVDFFPLVDKCEIHFWMKHKEFNKRITVCLSLDLLSVHFMWQRYSGQIEKETSRAKEI